MAHVPPWLSTAKYGTCASMARDDPKFIVRLPAELKALLEEAARVANRSMNAEIVERLAESLDQSRGAQLLSVYKKLVDGQREIIEKQEDLQKSGRAMNFMLFSAAVSLLRIAQIPETERSQADNQLVKEWTDRLDDLNHQFTPNKSDLEYWENTVRPFLKNYRENRQPDNIVTPEPHDPQRARKRVVTRVVDSFMGSEKGSANPGRKIDLGPQTPRPRPTKKG